MLKQFSPDEELASIYDIDIFSLKKRGKKGIIFDLDNTLRKRGASKLDEGVRNLFKGLEREGFKVGVLSNNDGMVRGNLKKVLDNYPIFFNAGKPRRAGFRKLLVQMGLKPSEVVMVGDQLFTDIYGAKRLGIYSILVSPVDPQEPLYIKFGRLVARLLLALCRLI